MNKMGNFVFGEDATKEVEYSRKRAVKPSP
jgi:hypothetical protein